MDSEFNMLDEILISSGQTLSCSRGTDGLFTKPSYLPFGAHVCKIFWHFASPGNANKCLPAEHSSQSIEIPLYSISGTMVAHVLIELMKIIVVLEFYWWTGTT